MKYHDITTDDMKNGDGLRTILWVSGCTHHCKNCHNPITWDPNVGLEFTEDTYNELIEKLSPSYISGLTISGGDPLFGYNLPMVTDIVERVKREFEDTKTIWVYTGYTWEELMEDIDIVNDYNSALIPLLKNIDVLVDGMFIEELADVNYPWAGSTNQRVIDVQKSNRNEVILYESH